MNTSPLELTMLEDSELAGRVDAKERGTLFTTIPYDEGWTVRVDGAAADARPVFDTFLGIELEVGEHEIQLSYTPRGLKEGRMITAASVGLLVLLAGAEQIWHRKNKKRIGDERI